MIQRFDLSLPHGITLSCRGNRASPANLSGAPRVVLLHGFPEAAFIWDDVIERLGEGVDALAPNLRGFERSTAPSDVSAYRAKHLVEDVAQLTQAWGAASIDLLVAHDWGGAVAWAVAAQRPDLLRRLLIINAPHPATFLRELRNNPVQQTASAYMNFLCRPDAATLLAANDYGRLWPFFTNMGGTTWLNETTKERYREAWRHGLEGGLNYYRASPLRPPEDDASALHRVVLDDRDVTVRLPTTVIWGEDDIALPTALLDGLQAYVPDMRLVRVPGASHWIVHEQPALIVDEIRRALGQR